MTAAKPSAAEKALAAVAEPVEAIRAESPVDVVAALARVQAEIGGIAKRRKPPEQGESGGLKYAFRGIDAVTSAAQPLFGKYGIVIVPNLDSHVVDDITVNSKPWTDTTVTVTWLIAGPNGTSLTARTVGLGRDNSDKGYAKAMTQAYKNLLLRMLTIGDPEDDTDGITHERDDRNHEELAPREPTEAERQVDELRVRLAALKARPDEAAVVKEWAKATDRSLSPRSLLADNDWRAEVITMLDELDDERGDVADVSADVPADLPADLPADGVVDRWADVDDGTGD